MEINELKEYLEGVRDNEYTFPKVKAVLLNKETGKHIIVISDCGSLCEVAIFDERDGKNWRYCGIGYDLRHNDESMEVVMKKFEGYDIEGFECETENLVDLKSVVLKSLSDCRLCYSITQEDGTLKFRIEDGDWKHEHLRADNVVRAVLWKYGIKVKIHYEEQAGEGGDWFTCVHVVEVA